MERTILVTGVSAGIGHALARHYLDAGHRVLGCSRREPAELIANERFSFAPVDLGEPESATDVVAELMQSVDHLHLAILNAGILGSIRDLADADLPEMHKVLDVNLWANKVVIDALFATVGRIDQVVTISSGAAVNGNRGWGAYSISKAALNMLTKLYAAERPETHFCALAPGIVDTAMQETLCGSEPDDRYPSVAGLRSKRGTPDMPDPTTAAPHLATAIDRLPTTVTSGDFADVRQLG